MHTKYLSEFKIDDKTLELWVLMSRFELETVELRDSVDINWIQFALSNSKWCEFYVCGKEF
jgi:hypothetical protein